ncbi:MAG: hypothetical protein HQL31_12370 [Planctomycetes bacterium]|nr:hypothetical protein [Planctomycetota bacterium]
MIAESAAVTETMAASVAEGAVAKVTDYDIIGVRSFYQGAIRSLLETALGTYDVKQWRAFGYGESGYFEMNDLSTTDTTKLRPGTGFWLISRTGGSVNVNGVDPESVSEYTVSIPSGKWVLLTNLFARDVVWQDVKVRAGDTESPVQVRVSDEENTYVNKTLWGMDKLSANMLQPYKPEAVMQPGKGYWVYNKSRATVAVLIEKPEGLAKPSDIKTLYKPEENTPPEAPSLLKEGGVSGSFSAGGGGGCLISH